MNPNNSSKLKNQYWGSPFSHTEQVIAPTIELEILVLLKYNVQYLFLYFLLAWCLRNNKY